MPDSRNNNKVSRRNFLKTGLSAAAALGFPAIVPSSVLGQFAPSYADQTARHHAAFQGSGHT
jgi:hypothetical protein